MTTSTEFGANTTVYAHWTYLGGGSSDNGSSTLPVDNKPETVITVPVKASASSDGKGNASVTVTQDKLNEIFRTAAQIAAQQDV